MNIDESLKRLADLDRQLEQAETDDQWVTLFEKWLELHKKIYGSTESVAERHHQQQTIDSA